jgi:hypothetical protein
MTLVCKARPGQKLFCPVFFVNYTDVVFLFAAAFCFDKLALAFKHLVLKAAEVTS